MNHNGSKNQDFEESSYKNRKPRSCPRCGKVNYGGCPDCKIIFNTAMKSSPRNSLNQNNILYKNSRHHGEPFNNGFYDNTYHFNQRANSNFLVKPPEDVEKYLSTNNSKQMHQQSMHASFISNANERRQNTEIDVSEAMKNALSKIKSNTASSSTQKKNSSSHNKSSSFVNMDAFFAKELGNLQQKQAQDNINPYSMNKNADMRFGANNFYRQNMQRNMTHRHEQSSLNNNSYNGFNGRFAPNNNYNPNISNNGNFNGNSVYQQQPNNNFQMPNQQLFMNAKQNVGRDFNSYDFGNNFRVANQQMLARKEDQASQMFEMNDLVNAKNTQMYSNNQFSGSSIMNTMPLRGRKNTGKGFLNTAPLNQQAVLKNPPQIRKEQFLHDQLSNSYLKLNNPQFNDPNMIIGTCNTNVDLTKQSTRQNGSSGSQNNAIGNDDDTISFDQNNSNNLGSMRNSSHEKIRRKKTIIDDEDEEEDFGSTIQSSFTNKTTTRKKEHSSSISSSSRKGRKRKIEKSLNTSQTLHKPKITKKINSKNIDYNMTPEKWNSIFNFKPVITYTNPEEQVKLLFYESESAKKQK